MRVNRESGFSLVELLIVVAIISIIAAIAVPGLARARMTANETSAIASLKATLSGQLAYSTSCGNGAYAATYVVLGTAPVPGSEPFISPDLGLAVAPQKSGYNFTMGPGAGSAAGPNDCLGTATISAWVASAAPQTHGMTGTRSFAVNVSNTIWQNLTAAPPAEPFGAPDTPVQ